MDIRTLLNTLMHGYSYKLEDGTQQLQAPNKYMLHAAKLLTALFEENNNFRGTIQLHQKRELQLSDEIQALQLKLKELNDQISAKTSESLPQELGSGEASESPNLPS